jgi:hypothetical protein
MSGVQMAVGHPLFSSSFEIFTAVLKSCIPFKTPCKREKTVAISLFYQLESFSSCFASLETKLNIRSSLHHYELSQQSAQYKILNMTEDEQQQKSE